MNDLMHCAPAKAHQRDLFQLGEQASMKRLARRASKRGANRRVPATSTLTRHDNVVHLVAPSCDDVA